MPTGKLQQILYNIFDFLPLSMISRLIFIHNLYYTICFLLVYAYHLSVRACFEILKFIIICCFIVNTVLLTSSRNILQRQYTTNVRPNVEQIGES